MKLIVGLGNPGVRYQKTRHNIGFMVLDELQDQWLERGASDWSLNAKFNAEISSLQIGKEKIFLLKPMTFMNESGQSVHIVAEYYKIDPKDILVIHDEKDIPLGEIKMQKDRGHAGHNGIRSIIDHLGTKDFHRIRIGIANPKKQGAQDTADFVLGKFGLLERTEVKRTIAAAIEHANKFMTMS